MRLKLVFALALAGAVTGTGISASARDEDPAQVPTAADFGAPAGLSNPILSPDGKLVAAQGLVGGKKAILMMTASLDIPATRPIPLPESYDIRWLRWAGNHRLLAGVWGTTRFYGEDVRITRVLSMDFESGKVAFVGPKQLGIVGDDVIQVDRDGKSMLLSAVPGLIGYPAVYRVDLTTGKAEKVVPPKEDVWSWFADPSGVVRAGVGARGKKWWLLYRDGPDQDFERSKRREIDDDSVGIDRFIALDGSDQGYAIAAGASGRFGLYRYDFRNDALGEQIYENPLVDIDDFDISREGKVLSVSYTDDRPEIAWFDPELKELQARIDRALPGKLNRVVSMSADKGRMLIWSGGADDPGGYYLYDRAARRINGLAATHETLVGKQLAPMQPVRFKARDGLEIRGYLTLPIGRGAQGLPLVVMPHGGPFVRDSWAYDPWVQYLASRGYAVLQPNFRGSTGFGRAFVEQGAGQWGRGMQDDIDDGVKWLAARGTVDAKRVCIMGASFGGYAAMWAAARNPELYRCAISFAGISDVASMLRYDRRSFAATRYFRDWQARVRGDKDFELDQISPIKQVARLTVPILIAHGEDDDNVPLYQSRRLHEALEKLGRAHQYVVYPDEGHGFTDPAHAADFLTRVGKFLDTHNPADPPR